jgi:hypothetical protein
MLFAVLTNSGTNALIQGDAVIKLVIPIDSSKKEIRLNVINYEDSAIDSEGLKNAVEKYWTCSKYDYITLEQVQKRCGQKNEYFILKMDTYGIIVIQGGYSSNGPHLQVKINDKKQKAKIIFDLNFMMVYLMGYDFPQPEFCAALLNSVFGDDVILDKKLRKSVWTENPIDGFKFYKQITADSLKGKSLIIEKRAADTLAKLFNNGITLFSYLSAKLGIPADNISVLPLNDFLSTFKAGKENNLYLYDYQRMGENTIFEPYYGINPFIIDNRGHFIALMRNYKEIRKLTTITK